MPSHSIHAFCDDALGEEDAVGIARKIAGKEISPQEVVEAAIARAQNANPSLNAIACEAFDHAREQAQSNQSGAFAGVPSFIKDNTDYAGLPTRHASRAVPAKPAKAHGSFSKQFRSTGLICLGKTTLPEFGFPPTTESMLKGPTNNPWHLEHSTGGSSGGAAALVAAGVVPIAHANDGGGSIRIPAACCGLVGLKPSRNRLVNMDGTDSLPINVGHEGVVTRSVRDTALFMAEAEKFFSNPKLPSLGHVESANKKRLRIGFISDAIGDIRLDDEVLKTVNATAQLCEDLGHEIEPLPMPFDAQIGEDFLDYYSFLFFMMTRFGKLMFDRKFDTKQVEQLTYDFGSRFARHSLRFPFVIRRLKQASKVTAKLADKYDVVLCPTLAAPPPKNGQLLNPEVASKTLINGIRDFAPFTALQNITGEPAISLPMGMSANSLPIGMQFSAGMGDDRTLLELAYEIEEAQAWKHLHQL